MADRSDVTGVWYGRYRGNVDPQENSFIALLEESGATISGSITEPDGGAGIRRAIVSGTRDGATIRFLKQYDGSGGWTHNVRYAGTVDAEGTAIHGGWQVDWLHGSFVMEREKFDADELEDEVALELDDPILIRP